MENKNILHRDDDICESDDIFRKKSFKVLLTAKTSFSVKIRFRLRVIVGLVARKYIEEF